MVRWGWRGRVEWLWRLLFCFRRVLLLGCDALIDAMLMMVEDDNVKIPFCFVSCPFN
jgi:hypothetical protein